MNVNHAAEFLTGIYRRFEIQVPTTHIVLGSGFASALDQEVTQGRWSLRGTLPFADLPGLPAPTVQGHSGVFKFFEHEETKKCISLQVGRLHGYEGHSPKQVVHPVMAFYLAGTSAFILTNAAGSLREEMSAGSLMLIEDQFNFTGQSSLVGPNPMDLQGRPIGTRFPDLSEVYDKQLRARLKAHLSQFGLPVFEGIYLGLLGPCFETPAEVSIFAKWGAHAVGMSTVWEAIALKHAGASRVKISGISLLSNLACGVGGIKPVNHEDILTQCIQSAGKTLRGVFSFLDKEFLDKTSPDEGCSGFEGGVK